MNFKALFGSALLSVIGLTIPTSASAQQLPNGWARGGCAEGENTCDFIKVTYRSGNTVHFLKQDDGVTYKKIADCAKWRTRLVNYTEWSDVLPGTVGEANFQAACSSRPTQSARPAPRVTQVSMTTRCNEAADRVFYNRYPQYRGKVIANMNNSLADEWFAIRRSVC